MTAEDLAEFLAAQDRHRREWVIQRFVFRKMNRDG